MLPRLKVEPYYQTVCENKPVTLSCVVEEGTPQPVVIWIRSSDGTELVKSQSKDTKYRIDKVEKYHTGNYSCFATNAAGNVGKTVSLHVESKYKNYCN